MNDDDSEDRKRQIEREARIGRTFSMADVVGREGAGFFHGESPVPMLHRAQAELCQFVREHVRDSSGALHIVLERHVRTSETILGQHLDEPFSALEVIVRTLLDNETWYYELVRQVDAEWGKLMVERPHFQQPGQEPHEDDEYTHDSVRRELESLLDQLHARRPATES